MVNEKHIFNEEEFRDFANKNFDPPKSCKNLGQVKFYIDELHQIIEELSTKFNKVPNSAFTLLSDYTFVQNKIINGEHF